MAPHVAAQLTHHKGQPAVAGPPLLLGPLSSAGMHPHAVPAPYKPIPAHSGRKKALSVNNGSCRGRRLFKLPNNQKLWKLGQWCVFAGNDNVIQNEVVTLVCIKYDRFAGRKPQNITDLVEAIDHEEWAKIPQERCQKLVSSCASRLQELITVK